MPPGSKAASAVAPPSSPRNNNPRFARWFPKAGKQPPLLHASSTSIQPPSHACWSESPNSLCPSTLKSRSAAPAGVCDSFAGGGVGLATTADAARAAASAACARESWPATTIVAACAGPENLWSSITATGRNVFAVLITLCAACHSRLHRLGAIDRWVPELLAELWAEQHPGVPLQIQFSEGVGGYERAASADANPAGTGADRDRTTRRDAGKEGPKKRPTERGKEPVGRCTEHSARRVVGGRGRTPTVRQYREPVRSSIERQHTLSCFIKGGFPPA